MIEDFLNTHNSNPLHWSMMSLSWAWEEEQQRQRETGFKEIMEKNTSGGLGVDRTSVPFVPSPGDTLLLFSC